MISERLWLITMRVVAVRLPSRCSPTFGGLSCCAKTRNETKAEKALVLWLNSTLGLLSMLGVRQETRGAWIDFKKPSLKALKLTRGSFRPTSWIPLLAPSTALQVQRWNRIR